MGYADLEGTIRDEATGLAVAGAEVRAVAESGREVGPLATSTTDGEGAFALVLEWPGDGEASVHLDARSRAHAAATWRSWHDDPPRAVRPGDTLVKDLALRPGFTLALDVRDDRDRPLEGARVDVIENNFVAQCCGWPLRLHPKLSPEILLPRSDAAGRVEVRGLRDLDFGWRYFISVTHPDWAEGLLDGLDPGAVRARVVLVQGHAVEGLLRGAGVGEANVTARLEDPAVPACHRVTRSAAVDASGRFRITGLHEGTHALHASMPGAARKVFAVHVPHDDTLAIEMPPCRQVHGTVLGEGGEPVARARITAEHADGQAHDPVETDATGSFSFSLPDDDRIVVAAFRDEPVFLEGLGLAILEPGSGNVDLVFDARDRGAWTGRLYDDRTGAPVEQDVAVVAELRGTNVRFRGEGNARDGRFELRLPPGEYALAFQAVGPFDQTHSARVEGVTIAPRATRADVRVDVAEAFSVVLRVIDAASNAAIPNAAVECRPPDIWSRVYLGNTDAEGTFAITPAIEGPIHVRVAAEGFTSRAVGPLDAKRGMGPVVVELDR